MFQPTTIVIDSLSKIWDCIKLFQSCLTETINPLKPKWVVSVEKYETWRSKKQNRLYWKWIGHIRSYIMVEDPIYDKEFIIGYKKVHKSKGRWHAYFALLFLDPIVITHPKTGEVVEIPQSTTELDTAEFTDYLNQINEWAHEHDVLLPHPDDQGR